ncbi:MAG: hypothetical protein JXQ83_14040 [Candidatus Glassbacteria bacterium]|nr:hypothetical protein [Candidatus Glassbacteria bacterium]
MSRKKHIIHSALWPCLAALVFCGCFSLPFIGGPGGAKITEPTKREFDRVNVFVGYDNDDRPIVEMRLLSQEVTDKGLIIHTRFFPTENFEVRNQFRGLRSINYYPVERRFHRLELRYGRKKIKTKVMENIQVRGVKPFLADFEHTGVHYLLADTIDRVKFKFQDVDRWDRLPVDTLDTWYASKAQYLQEVQRQTRRQNLLETYKRRQRQDETEEFTQYDSLFITANNTYVFLDKSVDSDILFTMNAGERVDFGVSDGIWVEFTLPDSLIDNMSGFLESRRLKALEQWKLQRDRRRTRAGARQEETEVDTTARMTAYVLDVMVSRDYGKALDWEKSGLRQPVDVPLFAQVLRDRAAAEIARLDSIEQARVDSIQAFADSVAMADSLRTDSLARADSLATASKARTDSTRADSSAGAAAQAPDSLAAADSTKSAGEPGFSLEQNYPNPVRPSTAAADSLAPGDSLAGEDSTGAHPPTADSTAVPADSAQAPDSTAVPAGPARAPGSTSVPADSAQVPDSTAAPVDSGQVELKQNYPNPFKPGSGAGPGP